MSPLGALAGKPAHLARKMGLVGIARLARQHGERRAGCRQQAQEALEAQDPFEGLGAVAEGLVAMPAQSALAPAEVSDQVANGALRRRPAPAYRGDGGFDDRIGGRHLRQPRNQCLLEDHRGRCRASRMRQPVRQLVDGAPVPHFVQRLVPVQELASPTRRASGRRHRDESARR